MRPKRVTAYRLCPRVLLAAVVAVSAPSAHGAEMDPAKLTCRAFMTSGQANMAVVIMWLRGFHAGKTGTTSYQASDPYGGRLGFYCAQHPDANLIESSEPILTNLDHGL
jgi:acid stress chaperone HdeB